MQKKTIVIIGGPGSGKTTIINKLLELGYCCYNEISRQVTIDAQKQGIEQLFLTNPLLFSELLLDGRKKQFLSAKNESSDVVFIDRGIPDILAYLDYVGQSYPASFDAACRENSYSKIFILPPWEEIFVGDSERYENYEQGKLIYEYLKKTYKFYGYELTEVPKDTLENRVLFILNRV